jgi:cytochrome c5
VRAAVSLGRLAAFALALIACGERTAPAAPAAPAPVLEARPAIATAGLPPWSDRWIDAHRAAWLGDPRARRQALESALVARDTHYAEVRLGNYELPSGGWSSLPEWAPRSVPVDSAIASAFERGERPSVPQDAASFEGAEPHTDAEWLALGRRVFFELPLRAEPVWEAALRDRALGERVGLARDANGGVPGLVLMRDLDGQTQVGITCALCHSAPRAGDAAIVPGRARRALDYGRIQIESATRGGRPLSPEGRARWESWGPGRADVLEERSEVPIAMPDLYSLRELRWLSQGAILRHDSPLALAVRQETQFVQANHLRTRPPRTLVWALVVFLYSLTPPPITAEVVDPRGEALFQEHCVRCHSSSIGSGAPVGVDEVGTNRELATGRARGTGHYRPSPLLRVRDAAPYLHHGAVPTLEELFSETRAEPGHRFGSTLPEADRAALIAWLRTR